MLTLFAFFFVEGNAQNLAAFSDTRLYFHVFDNGYKTQLEHQPIQNFKTARGLLAYIDNTNTFKVHVNGNTTRLQEGGVDEYFLTDHLMVYRLGQQLKVYDDGVASTLSAAESGFAYGDSIVGWYDAFQQELRVYENGKITKLEDGLVNATDYQMKAAGNMLGWINPQGYFKIRYKGETHEIFYGQRNINFKVGLDIMAWFDPSYTAFFIDYKGKEYEMGEFFPMSYEVGDELVAFVDPVGTFQAFWKGQLYEIAAFPPATYYIKDGMVIYQQQGRFKVFYNGEIKVLEMYIPEDHQAHLNSIVWRDQLGGLKAFIDGREHIITTERVSNYQLNGDVVQFVSQSRYAKVWMNGKIY